MNQLVSCGGMDCSLCSMLQTLSVVFSFLIGVASAVAILFLVVGGFIYLTALGEEKKIKRAKNWIKYALFGFGFAIISFLVISIIFRISGADLQKNWWNFDCFAPETGGVIEPERLPTKQIHSRIGNEIEDNAPIIKKMAGLNQITDNNRKIGIFDLEKINAQNLKQDLINLFSGDAFRLIATNKSLSDEDIADYALIDNGFSGRSSDEKVNKIFDQIEKIADFRKDDGDISLITNDEGESSGSTLWWNDPKLDQKLEELTQKLKEKPETQIIAYKDARAQGSLSYCVDSSGDFTEFDNECQAKKNTCGNQDLVCSSIYNPAMGCQCPTGSCSLNGKCVPNEAYEESEKFGDSLEKDSEKTNDKDDDGDGVLNELDHCPNTPSDQKTNTDRSDYNYGCSCSQISLAYRSCPQSRCEGETWIEYPISGYDSCKDGYTIKHSCEARLSTGQDYRCTAEQNKNNNRSEQQNNPDQTTSKGDESESNSSGNPGNQGNGNTGSSTGNGGTNNGQSTDGGNKMPPDLGPGNFNPTPSFKELAECIGFKDGKIPYNGVLVLLLNKEDPTNERHPNNNASRLFYLTRNGQVIGNAGDPNGAGLKVGPWTKGSGGTAWSPGWNVIPNAQDVHVNGSPDPYSFKAGAGHRVGPQGEKMNHNGTLNPSGGKVQDMSGCNMHSGNRRSHSRGCMTMGGTERRGFTEKVKSLATKSGGKVLMARLIADNTDPNSQKVQSDSCGKMDPEKAINQFKTLGQYRNWNPNEGY